MVLPLAALLLGLVGLTALFLAVTRDTAVTVRADSNDRTAAIVRRFYTAVNEAVRTGDLSQLDSVLASQSRPTEPTGGERCDVRCRISALHRLAPHVQLSIEELLVDGNRVAARLNVEGLERHVLLGLPLQGDLAPWAAVDILDVADGQVVAVQPAAGMPALIEPLARTDGMVIPSGPYRLGLIRLVLEPNRAIADLSTRGPMVLLVERGTLALRVDRPTVIHRPEGDGLPTAVDMTAVGTVTLSRGQQLTMGAETAYRVRNSGTEPAVVLVATLQPGHDGLTNRWIQGRTLDEVLFAPGEAEGASQTGPPISWPAGVHSDLLANGAVLDAPTASVRLALTRLTLPSHAALPDHAVLGTELLAVETGSAAVELTAGDGALRPHHGASPAKIWRGGSSTRDHAITAGGNAMLQVGASAGVRNAGAEQLVLLILSVEPQSV